MAKRHKYIFLALAVYWLGLFIITHIPVPDLARKSGMSDKTMHSLAYMILVFFWWGVVGGTSKVNWRRLKVWITLAIMVWYGAVDELIQGRVGRSCDITDFIADLIGTLLGLGILTYFSFWPAAMVVSGIFIFCVTNLSKIDLLYPEYHLNAGFHFLSYAVFTLIWIQQSHKANISKPVKCFFISMSLPIVLLVTVKGFSPVFGRDVWLTDCMTALSGITAAAVISFIVTQRKKSITETDDTKDRQSTASARN